MSTSAQKPTSTATEPTEPTEANSVLSDALNAYSKDRDAYKMIEGEFRVDKDKVDAILDKAKDDLFDLLPDARDMAEALMRGAQSEAIRWQVTKYILDYCLKGGEAEDDMARLVSSLKGNKKSTPTA